MCVFCIKSSQGTWISHYEETDTSHLLGKFPYNHIFKVIA